MCTHAEAMISTAALQLQVPPYLYEKAALELQWVLQPQTALCTIQNGMKDDLLRSSKNMLLLISLNPATAFQ